MKFGANQADKTVVVAIFKQVFQSFSFAINLTNDAHIIAPQTGLYRATLTFVKKIFWKKT